MAGIGKDAEYIAFTVPKAEYRVLENVADGGAVAALVKRALLAGMLVLYPNAGAEIKAIREAYRGEKKEKRREIAKNMHAGIKAAHAANTIGKPTPSRPDRVDTMSLAMRVARSAAEKRARLQRKPTTASDPRAPEDPRPAQGDPGGPDEETQNKTRN